MGRAMRRQFWTSLSAEYAVMAFWLFAGAGTVNWPAGWIFFVLFAALNTWLCFRLETSDPRLFDERLNMFNPRGQPLWDRILFAVLMALILAWLLLAGVEAGRLGHENFPVWFRVCGAILMLGGLYGTFYVMGRNTFLAPTVRIQVERQHRLVSDGPYAIVRHPFYTLLTLHFIGGSIMLNSLWSLAAALVIGLLFAYRCTREEAFLLERLDGYAAYAQSVRYRLVPYVW